MHIRCSGNDCLWFRPYGESLSKSAKVTKALLPHHSVPRLGSACPHSGIAPWVAAMGHPWPNAAKPASCRFTHCAMPAFGHRGLTGRPRSKTKARRPDSRPDLFQAPQSLVGASGAAIRLAGEPGAAVCLLYRVIVLRRQVGSPHRWLLRGVHPQNQVGYQAASRLILILLLIFLPHREAEWRFCAVGKPAWMPV